VNGTLTVSSDLDRCLTHLDIPLGFEADWAFTFHIVECGLLSLDVEMIIPTLGIEFLVCKSTSVIRRGCEPAILGGKSTFKIVSGDDVRLDGLVTVTPVLANVLLDMEALVNSRFDDSR